MLIAVKAHAHSKQNKVLQTGKDTFEIWCSAPATHGRANAEIIRMLSKRLKIAKSLIKLKTGGASRNKRFEIIF